MTYIIKISVLINGLFIKDICHWQEGKDWQIFCQRWQEFAKAKGFKAPSFFIENPLELPMDF